MTNGARIDRLLAESGCAALLVVAQSSRDPDLAPLIGPAHLGRALLVWPLGGAPRLGYFTPMERGEAAATGLSLLDPETLGVEELRGAGDGELLAGAADRALRASGVAPGRVALAGHGAAGVLLTAGRALAAHGWELVAGSELAARLRKTKSADHLTAVRAAAVGAVDALRRVAGHLAAAAAASGDRPGSGEELWLGGERLTVGRLRREVAMALAARGLEQPEGNILAPGAAAALPHSTGDDARVLRAGEALVADLFPRGTVYADCTRTFCVGPVPPALAAAHAAVLDALAAARRLAVAGARGWDVQLATCGVLADRGYPTPVSHPGSDVGYVHNVGHGVGFELHELPSFRQETGAEGVLEIGDVFTLEPGLYHPGEGWGVRVEDLLHLGPGGAEVLTELPWDLEPRAY